MEITEEFREKVNKAARSVANRNNGVDWEDISQDMWVRFLEDPKYYDTVVSQEDCFPSLKRLAKQEAHKANSAFEHFSGNYTYTPGEVRALLTQFLVDATLESLAEHVDLVEGMLLLQSTNSAYFTLLVDKFVRGKEPKNTSSTTRSVDKLTYHMNKVNRAARYTYEGIGSRRVVSNSTATSWTDLERGQQTSSKNDRDWMGV